MARTDELKAILDDLPGSTTSAKLKALIPSIDAKVRAGARHEEIIEALKQQGFNLTLANFRSILYRYRKRIRESPEKQMEEKQNGNSAPVERTQPKPDGNSSTPEPASIADQIVTTDLELPPDFLTNEASREKFADQYLARRSSLGLRSKKK